MADGIQTYDQAKNEIIVREEKQNEESWTKNLNEKLVSQSEKIEETLKKYLEDDEIQNFSFSKSSDIEQIENKISNLLENDKLKLFCDCENDNIYTLGYLVLPKIKDKIKFDDFEKWANIALRNSNDSYVLPEDNRETVIGIIENYIKSKKFDLERFDDVAELIQKTGSEKMLSLYEKLVDKAVQDYESKIKSKNFFFFDKKENELKQIQTTLKDRFEKCIQEITEFVKNQTKNSSYTWYLEMNPEFLEKIFKETEKTTNFNVIQESFATVEDLLKRLLSYYVETTRKIISAGLPINLAEKWNLDSAFQIIAERTQNQNLKIQIFNEYLGITNGAKNLPLPLPLIKNSLYGKNSTASESTKKIMIENLKWRFVNSKSDDLTIQEIIKNTIAKSVDVKKFAFDSFKAVISENTDFSREIFESLATNYKDENDVNSILKECAEILIQKEKQDLPQAVFDFINDENVGNYDLRFEILELIIKNLDSDDEKSAFLRKINICDEDLTNQPEKDLPFLRKSVLEFLKNKNSLPSDKLFLLVLTFLKNASDDFPIFQNLAEYKNCVDFIFENRNSPSFSPLKNQIIDIFSDDKITRDLRRYIFEKWI